MTDNIIINGGPSIWRSGTIFTLSDPFSGTQIADSWVELVIGSTAVATLQRSTSVPGRAAGAFKDNYCIHVDVTTADASVAAGDLAGISYRLEGYRALPFIGDKFTVGFWIKNPKSGKHCVSVANSGQNRSCVRHYDQILADTWEFHHVTFPSPDTGGTWSYTTGIGLNIRFPFLAGTDWHAPSDFADWQTTNEYGLAGIVNDLDNVANNIYIYGLTVNPGDKPLPYVPPFAPEEEFELDRYYQILGGSSLQVIGFGYWTSTTKLRVHLPLSRELRTAPSTLLVDNSNYADISAWIGSTEIACSAQPTLISTSAKRYLLVDFTVASGGTAGQPGMVTVKTGASEVIRVDARL